MGKMIHWKLCNRLKFDISTNCRCTLKINIKHIKVSATLRYKQNSQSCPDPVLKKTHYLVDIVVPANHRLKMKEREKISKY